MELEYRVVVTFQLLSLNSFQLWGKLCYRITSNTTTAYHWGSAHQGIINYVAKCCYHLHACYLNTMIMIQLQNISFNQHGLFAYFAARFICCHAQLTLFTAMLICITVKPVWLWLCGLFIEVAFE